MRDYRLFFYIGIGVVLLSIGLSFVVAWELFRCKNVRKIDFNDSQFSILREEGKNVVMTLDVPKCDDCKFQLLNMPDGLTLNYCTGNYADEEGKCKFQM